MRVAQINSVCGIRSTGRIMSDLSEMLIKEGHLCIAAYGRESVPGKCENYAVKIGSRADTYLHALYTRLLDKTGFGSVKATKDFIRKLEAFSPDLIHLHNLHGYYINIDILFGYLKEKKIPVVWTLHDCWAFTGHCSHFEYAQCDKWKTQCYGCTQKKEYPSSMLIDGSFMNYKKKKQLFTSIENMTIVTPSNWLASLCSESFLKKYPIRVINNGIDLNVFKATKSNLREQYNIENRKVVLAVSSAWGDGRKGYYDILQLPGLLGDEYQVVIIGVTGKEKNMLPDSIIGIERTNSMCVLAQWYTEADVFVNPTYEDNFPTTNMEAIACGTPVITYPSGGSPEIVSEKTGFITEHKDIREMAELIPEACKLSSQTVQEKAKDFDKLIKFKKYIELYKEILYL